MKKYIIIVIFALAATATAIKPATASQNLEQGLSGRILLQVESRGEAWYVNPADLKRYFLGRPQDAFDLMKKMGMGITDSNLDKIPIGIIESAEDDDRDGLSNSLENALGANPNKADSDNDGFNDKCEIENHYNPAGAEKYIIDNDFVKKVAGKIFLQVEKNGEAWYVNPADNKRYYLGRPSDAFAIMRALGLGISNNDISGIATTEPQQSNTPSPCSSCQTSNAEQALAAAANAIRSGDIEKTVSYFTKDKEQLIRYTMNFLNSDGKLTLGNILSGSKLKSSTANEAIYANEIYFSLGGYKVSLEFHIKKQPDGKWLLTNL